MAYALTEKPHLRPGRGPFAWGIHGVPGFGEQTMCEAWDDCSPSVREMGPT
jgi:hypothetical protein